MNQTSGDARGAPTAEQQLGAVLTDLAEIDQDIAGLSRAGVGQVELRLGGRLTGIDASEAAKAAVSEALGELAAEHYSATAASGRLARATDAVASARDALEQLAISQPVDEDKRHLAMVAVTALASAQAQVRAAAAMATEGEDGDEAISFVSDTVMLVGPIAGGAQKVIGKLKAVLSSIWHLLAHILKPTEWKISGELSGGIPSLGMAKAGIEITFG